jgi:hypothetical protein
LLQREIFRNIRAAFTTTVYAFLNPRRPSAAWDFFFSLNLVNDLKRLSPTGQHRSSVGASLLAIAEGQATSILKLPAPSLASQLPQFFGVPGYVGASLLATAVGQATSMLNVPAYRRQASSHSFCGVPGDVGASLLAIAVGQATSMLNVPAYRRQASPTVFCGVPGNSVQPATL